MAKFTTRLTDMQVKNAKLKSRTSCSTVAASTSTSTSRQAAKIWRLKFRQPNGKENRLTFGPYQG